MFVKVFYLAASHVNTLDSNPALWVFCKHLNT